MDHSDTDDFFNRLRTHARDNHCGDNPYEIIEEVARGGQSVVYLARNTDTGERVAIKHPVGHDAHADTRLQREVELISLLEHPYVLSNYRLLRSESGVSVVMPWIDGITADRWCARESVNDRDRSELFLKICDALTHTHARGVVHRDMRPNNVLVRDNGTPCVIDFGIANRIEFPEENTFGSAGDLHYLAPEILGSIAPPPDARQDVYSLGVMLYTMHAGTHPLSGLSIGECIDRLRRGSLFDDLPDGALPGSLGAIVRKATSADLNARYQSVESLAADVRSNLDGRLVRARAHSVSYLCSQFWHRNRPVLLAGAASILLLIGGSVVLAKSLDRESEAQVARGEFASQHAAIIEAIQATARDHSSTPTPLAALKYAERQIEAVSGTTDSVELLVLADSRVALARSYQHLLRDEMGLSHVEEALRIYLMLLDPDAERLRATKVLHAQHLTAVRRFSEAEDILNELLKTDQFEQSDEFELVYAAAQLRTDERRFDEAWKYYERCLQLTAPDEAARAELHLARGIHLNRWGRSADALGEFERSAAIAEAAYGPDCWGAITAQLFAVKSMQKLGQYERVLSTLDVILPEATRILGSHDSQVLRCLAHLAIAETETGNPVQGLKYANILVGNTVSMHPEGYWYIVQAKSVVAHALLALGRPHEVVSLLLEYQEAPATIPPAGPGLQHLAKFWLARAYNDLTLPEQAMHVATIAHEGSLPLLGPDNQFTARLRFEQIRAAALAGDTAFVTQSKDEMLWSARVSHGPGHSFTEEVHRFFQESTGQVSASPNR